MENNENNYSNKQSHPFKKDLCLVALMAFVGSFLAFYLLAHQTYIHFFSPMKNKFSNMERDLMKDFQKMENDTEKMAGLTKREMKTIKNKISAVQSAKYEDAYVIVIDLKQFGNDENNIRFAINGNTVTVSGTTTKNRKNSENEYYFSESFEIPEKIKMNEITKEKINNKYVITLPIED